MQIRGWHIDGFGHFQDVQESQLPGGITVFLGPNEAGKSTLLAFIRGMLFGFPAGKNQNRYVPLHTRHMGGKLFIETPMGAYTIQRTGDRKEGFRLYRPDDTPGSESELSQLLGHTDQGLFKSVFAFSLAELQNLNVHKEEGIKDRIFAGSLQGGRNTAREALTTLERQNAPIFKPRGREVELVKLSKQLDDLQAQIQTAKQRAQEYEGLRSQEDALTETLERLTREQAALQRHIARHETLLTLWPRWLEREACLAELDALDAVEHFPPQAEARQAEAVSAIRGLESTLADLEAEHESLAQRLGEIQLDPTVAELTERISTLSGDAQRFIEWIQGLAENAEQRNHARGQLEAALAALGKAWTRERLKSFDASIPQLDQVSRWETLLDASESAMLEGARDVKEARRHAETASAAVAEQRRRLAQGEDVPEVAAIALGEDRLVRLRTNLTVQRDLQAEQRALDEKRLKLEIEFQNAPSDEPTALPQALRLGLRIAVLLLLAMAAWKGVARDGITAGVLAIMAIASGLLSAVKVQATQTDPQARRFLTEQLQHAKAQQEEAQAAMDRLLASLRADALAAALSAQPSAAEIEALGQKLMRARDLAKTKEALQQELERLIEQEREAQERLAQALGTEDSQRRYAEEVARAWTEWRQAAGIEEDRSPRGAAQLFQALITARQFLVALEALEANGGALHQKAEGFRQVAIALLADAHEPRPETDTQLVQGLGRLQERQQAALELELEHAQLSRASVGMESKIAIKREELGLAQQALAELYAEAGAEDEAGFHHRRAVHGRRQELQRSLQDIERFLDEQLGRDAQAQDLRALLGAAQVESWKVAITEAELSQAAIVQQRDEANQLLGTIRQERERLEENADVIACEHAHEALRDEFQRQSRAWLVRALAEDMIQEALSEAERTRQPAVLSHASRLFRQVTAERYERLVQQEGGEFQVVDRQATRKSVGQLSQGTAEQLYLCLRLGLIREFARQSANLPLIMDDVFVNFDPERARRVAELLVEFAAEHQVLVFTCHPQTAELLLEVQPTIRIVSMPRYGGDSAIMLERKVAVLTDEAGGEKRGAV